MVEVEDVVWSEVEERPARHAVIGLGYTELPLSFLFVEAR